MDDYVSKPIKPEQLQAALSRWAGAALIEVEQAQPAVPRAAPTPAAGANQRSKQVITFALLEDYFGDEPATITKLLSLFQSTGQTLIVKLGESIAQHNASAVVAIAHEIKGSCGNIGIEHMAHIASQLETVATALDWPGMESSRQQLVEAFDDVVAAIAAR
jgi:HPt (histidine-containing phosphotransfer) domain-containing protein